MVSATATMRIIAGNIRLTHNHSDMGIQILIAISIAVSQPKKSINELAHIKNLKLVPFKGPHFLNKVWVLYALTA